jgi:hypothetical protein
LNFFLSKRDIPGLCKSASVDIHNLIQQIEAWFDTKNQQTVLCKFVSAAWKSIWFRGFLQYPEINTNRPFLLIQWLVWCGTPPLVNRVLTQKFREYLHRWGILVFHVSNFCSKVLPIEIVIPKSDRSEIRGVSDRDETTRGLGGQPTDGGALTVGQE